MEKKRLDENYIPKIFHLEVDRLPGVNYQFHYG